MDQIRAWAIQDYQFRAAVPRIAMLRYFACTDPEIARKLWGVVEEETRGIDTGSAVQKRLAIRFANAIGLTRAIGNAELRPSTAAHLYYVEFIIHTLPWFVVMSIQIGAEGTFGPAAAAIGNGLLKNYNMNPDDVRFFTVHTEADEEHSSLAEEIAVRYLHSPALQEQTYKATFAAWNCSTIYGQSTATINKQLRMEQLTLSFISAFNERVEPLMNGTIKVEGRQSRSDLSHPAETFGAS